MSLCINPKCPRPDHPGNNHNRYCASCGSDLLLNDRYRVLRLLSDKTGFGKIYETYERTTPKILKVLKEDWNTNSKVVALFEQEARVLGKLEHPGIPKVDGYFQHPVSPQGWITAPLVHCIVMEKVDGLNLDEWLVQQGSHPISQKQALQWLKQVVEVLELIHANHYFHRDIKPGNIMLNRSGQLVLIDFGTARDITYTYMAKQQAGHKITAIASAGFTPPEQANGHAVPQSDFFALGRSFVQLLTGKHPLEMYDSNNDEFRWREHTVNVSPLLLDLLDRMMARRMGDRPTNTQTLLQEIGRIENKLNQPVKPQSLPAQSYPPQPVKPQLPEPIKAQNSKPVSPPTPLPPPSVRPSRRNPKRFSGAVLSFAGLIGVVIFFVSLSFRADPFTLLVSQSFLKKNLSGHSDSISALAISPDGQTLASGSTDKTIKIWNLKTGELLHTLSDHSSTVFGIAISPDGQTLVSRSGNTTKAWKLKTGELLRTLEEDNSSTGIVFGEDNSSIGIVSNGQVVVEFEKIESPIVDETTSNSIRVAGHVVNDTAKVWNPATGELRQRILRSTPVSVSFLRSYDYPFIISPDRQTIVSWSGNSIRVWDLEAGGLLHELRHSDDNRHSDDINLVAISPDGQTIIGGSNDDTIRVWNLKTGELLRTLEGKRDRDVDSVAISPDGKTIISCGNDKTIQIWNLETGELIRTLAGHSSWLREVAISPDGQTIVSGSADGTIKIWRLK